MLWIDGVRDRRSWAFLKRNFRSQTGKEHKARNESLWKPTPLLEIRPKRVFPQRLGKHKALSTVPTRLNNST